MRVGYKHNKSDRPLPTKLLKCKIFAKMCYGWWSQYDCKRWFKNLTQHLWVHQELLSTLLWLRKTLSYRQPDEGRLPSVFTWFLHPSLGLLLVILMVQCALLTCSGMSSLARSLLGWTPDCWESASLRGLGRPCYALPPSPGGNTEEILSWAFISYFLCTFW